MKWLVLAILAEFGVLVCLIVAFDDALHSLTSARVTWDHLAVAVGYSLARLHFSWRRSARQVGPARVPVPHF